MVAPEDLGQFGKSGPQSQMLLLISLSQYLLQHQNPQDKNHSIQVIWNGTFLTQPLNLPFPQFTFKMVHFGELETPYQQIMFLYIKPHIMGLANSNSDLCWIYNQNIKIMGLSINRSISNYVILFLTTIRKYVKILLVHSQRAEKLPSIHPSILLL